MKKKKKAPAQQPLSPARYLKTRARLLPVHKCLVNSNWEESGIATVTVARKHVNDHITAGFYLVDLLALGVKDTHFVFNQPGHDFFDRLKERHTSAGMDLVEIPYVLAHNIIYGAVAFADEHDLSPHKDFSITRYILEEDTEDIELIDIPFGVDGKPGFIETVKDNDA